MKKTAILLLAFALLCSCFALAACSDESDDSPSTATDTSSAATSSEEESSPPAEESSEEPSVSDSKPFWVTHYNDSSKEGAGVIFGEKYTGGGWWMHVAFAPVDGEDGVYEVVDTSNGIAEGGEGKALDIPEGGFVYAINVGNDYPKEINPDGSGIDYTSQPCKDMAAIAQAWRKGDKFTFENVDFDNFKEIPTATPDVEWYQDQANDSEDTGDYVCTATFTKVS